jgi:putative NADH-flavin reductase
MNILIVGASRGIGLQLIAHALGAGHAVTALVRHPEHIVARHDSFRKIKGDILDPAAVSSAVAGQDAVVCTIGKKTPWEQSSDLFSRGTDVLLRAMDAAHVRRLVCVTGIGAGDSRGHGGFLYDRIFLPFVLKSMYDDKDRQEARIRGSNTEWTIVRPGFLTNGPLTGDYRVLTELQGVTAGRISRADVAHFILQELENPRYVHRTPLLTY